MIPVHMGLMAPAPAVIFITYGKLCECIRDKSNKSYFCNIFK